MKKINIKKYKYIIIIISYLFSVMFFSQVNSQYIKFQSWTETLKMFCDYQRDIIFDVDWNSDNTFWFYLTVDFDPNKISLQANNFSVSNIFQHLFNPGLYWWIYGSNSKLIVQDNTVDDQNGELSWIIWKILFSSKKTLSAEFVINSSWYWINDINGDTDLLKQDSSDFVRVTEWANYNFITGLCDDDIIWPNIENFTPNILSNNRLVWYWFRTLGPIRNVSEKISSASWLSFWLRDGDNYTKNQPGYSTGVYWSLDFSNYQDNIADRASGIDPITLSFSISKTPTIFNASNLSTFSGSDWTRNRRIRDYFVKINWDKINNYWIEWNILFTSHIAEYSQKSKNLNILFNQIVSPWITDLYPNNLETQILPVSDIKLAVRDDRAGINPSTITVTVKSWSTILGIFSWSDLHLSWSTSDANTQDYYIHIYSWTNWLEYPISTVLNTATQIDITVFVEDNNWNNPRDNNQTTNKYDRYKFYTRYSCQSYPGCSDALKLFIYTPWWRTDTKYYNTNLYITWSLDASLDTWTNILDCWTPLVVTKTWTKITWAWLDRTYTYSWEKLYIHGWTVINIDTTWGKIMIQAN